MIDNMRAWLETKAYEQQKEIVNKRVNSFPMVIEYEVFEKTEDEKLLLLKMKVNLPKTRGYKFVKVLHEQF